MNYAQRQRMLFHRERFPDIVPVNAYMDGLFYCGGDQDYLGSVWAGVPLIGADDSTVEMLRAALSGDTPTNTLIQISYLSSSYIDQMIGVYARQRINILKGQTGLKAAQKEVMQASYKRRTAMLKGSAKKAVVKSSGVLTKNTTLIITVKVPVSGKPNQRELEAVEAAMVRFEQAFKTVGLGPTRLDAKQYLQLVRSVLMMGTEPESYYNDDKLIKEQVLPKDAEFGIEEDHVRVTRGDQHYFVRSLSAQAFPKLTSLATMNQVIGDPQGSHSQVPDPFMITTTIFFPDSFKKTNEIRKKENAVNYQSQGPWYKFVARLRSKKEDGFDVLGQSLEEGNRPVMVWFNVLLFNRSAEDSARAAASLRTFYQVSGYEMHEDRYSHGPYMLLQLPLFAEVESVRRSARFNTMSTKEVVQMLPVIGEWKGSGTGAALMMAGRRGQAMVFDLFDSTTNYNAVIAAESGAGKSFLANDLIMAYLQKGGKVRVVDQGGSYAKLCESASGEWIEFDEKVQLCLNPFTHVQDINEEMELLKIIISKMAKPKEGFDDWQMAQTEIVIQELWDEFGGNMTVTDVAQRFTEKGEGGNGPPEPRLLDMGQMLHSFTRHGIFGKYFDGPNTLDYNNNFVVLELQHLMNMKHLQQVVMLQLIAQLQTECYLGDRSQQKVIIIDEAWELFTDPIVAKFLEGAYRKFRKYGASCVVITQSLDDLYKSASGDAVAKNSANVIVLRQKSEAIEGLKKSGRFNIGEYGYEMLRSLHTQPGEYADVMLACGESWGVGRFVVDRFSQLLYSTSPREVEQLRQLQEAGMTIAEAIDYVIAVESGHTPSVTPTRTQGEGAPTSKSAGKKLITA